MKLLFTDYLKNLFNKSNEEQVISIGLSLLKILALLFIIILLGKPEILNSNGIWTLITAIISSPILFIIWRFRDHNATQQIENQRKDINLKEFQKIAEWVSGAHLIEEEITDKRTNTSGNIVNTPPIEQTIKYTQPNSQQSIPTFSKRDGAVGLQIAAIYNLLPFFQGKHGEDFRKPALNLLTSAWLALQQKEVLKLEQIDILENKEEFDKQIQRIQQRANSPIGIALTEVLLSDGGNNLLKFPEVFPNLNLAGMNFHLPGLDKKVLTLFQKAKNCQGINLIGANLFNADLSEAKLLDAKLQGTQLTDAQLQEAQLHRTQLQCANLTSTNLQKSQLYGAQLYRAELHETQLQYANLASANLQQTLLLGAKLYRTQLLFTNLLSAFLEISALSNAILIGSVIDNKINSTEILDSIKSQGGIVLYLNLNKQSKKINIQVINKQDNKTTYSYNIYYALDLEKTREENPDWEINVEIIEEE